MPGKDSLGGGGRGTLTADGPLEGWVLGLHRKNTSRGLGSSFRTSWWWTSISRLPCYGLHSWPWVRTNPFPLQWLLLAYLMAEMRQWTCLPILLKLTATLLRWVADIHKHLLIWPPWKYLIWLSRRIFLFLPPSPVLSIALIRSSQKQEVIVR